MTRINARTWLWHGAVMVAALGLMCTAGCGGSGGTAAEDGGLPRTSAEEAGAPEASAEATETSAESVGDPVVPVGTLTVSDGEGTSFEEEYRLGPLLYSDEGTPPEAVLDACGANYGSTISQTVFSKGETTITYSEGTLATDLPIVPSQVVAGEAYIGEAAFEIDGSWECLDTFSLTFEPGESQTIPFWLLSQVLSNAEPEVPEEKLNTWRFTGPQVSFIGSSEAEGPGAAVCPSEEQEEMLMVYARPPFAGMNSYGKPVTCKPVG